MKAISESNSSWPFWVLHNMEGAEAMWVTQNHRPVSNLWLDGEVRYTEVESSADKRKELRHSDGRNVADDFFSNSPWSLSERLLKQSLQHAKMCTSLLSVDTGMAIVNPSICANSQWYLWALPQALAIYVNCPFQTLERWVRTQNPWPLGLRLSPALMHQGCACIHNSQKEFN